MAKKKVQYPNKVRNTVITCAVSILLVALLIVVVAFNVESRNYAFKFNNEKVSVKEYMVYLYQNKLMYESYLGADVWTYAYDEETSMQDYVKSISLTGLAQQKLSALKVEEFGLSLSQEQKDEAVANLETLKTSLGQDIVEKIGLSDKNLLQFMEDEMKMNLLYEDQTKDYIFDEADFKTYFENYKTENEHSIIDVNVNYILTDDKEKAEEAKAKIEAGEDIYELIKQYSVDYTAPEAAEEGEEEPVDERMTPSPIADVYVLTEEIINAAYEMNEGDISEVFQIGEEAEEDSDEESEDGGGSVAAIVDGNGNTVDGDVVEEEIEAQPVQYVVFKVNNIVHPDYEELEETQKETYINEKKDEIFSPLFEEWSNAVELEVNETKVAGIDITSI